MVVFYAYIMIILKFSFDGNPTTIDFQNIITSDYRRCKHLQIFISYDALKTFGRGQLLEFKLKSTIKLIQNIYAWHNLEVRIRNMEHWEHSNHIPITHDWSVTLQALSSYYSRRFYNRQYRYSTLLFTSIMDKIYTNSVLGLSYRYTECTSRAVGLILIKRESTPIKLAIAAAHEYGHIIGLAHADDPIECKCAFEGGCIMAPLINEWSEKKFPPAFHTCSAKYLKERRTVCGENCDNVNAMYDVCESGVLLGPDKYACNCGVLEVCAARGADKCCESETCQLKSNSECSVEECCRNCKITGDVICRARRDSMCDLTEYCNGKELQCPKDSYVANGHKCTPNGYCYDGLCSDKDMLCRNMLQDSTAKYSKRCEKYMKKKSKLMECFNIDLNKLTNVEKFICQYTHECLPIVCESPGPAHVSVTKVRFKNFFRQTITCYFHDQLDYHVINGLPCDATRICIEGVCKSVAEITQKCETHCPHGKICNNSGECVFYI